MAGLRRTMMRDVITAVSNLDPFKDTPLVCNLVPLKGRILGASKSDDLFGLHGTDFFSQRDAREVPEGDVTEPIVGALCDLATSPPRPC